MEKYLKNRREIMQDRKTVDWAAAELMAYGALVREGNIVRMSGQDVKRGTFSHRHAVIYDEKSNEQFNRIGALEMGDGRFMIYNSHLSEYGVPRFRVRGTPWPTRTPSPSGRRSSVTSRTTPR